MISFRKNSIVAQNSLTSKFKNPQTSEELYVISSQILLQTMLLKLAHYMAGDYFEQQRVSEEGGPACVCTIDTCRFLLKI